MAQVYAKRLISPNLAQERRQMATPRIKAVISKHWHKPEITFAFDRDGMSLSIPVEDLAAALATELGLGSPKLLHRIVGVKPVDREVILTAARAVVEKLKHASTQAIIP